MGRSPARPEGGRHERSSCVSAEPKRAAPPTGSLQRVKKEKEVEHDNKLPGAAHP